MPIGGPVASIGAFASNFRPFGKGGRSGEVSLREQLNESLRLLKEDREAKDAIAKERLALDKEKAEFGLAQSELALNEQRRAQIMASPGKTFRDSGLEGALEKARDRVADAHAAVQERQDRINGLMEDRDARIRSSIPQRAEGGFLGFNQSASPPEKQLGRVGSESWGTKRSKEQLAADKAAIVSGEKADEETPEGKEFRKDYRSAEGELRRDLALESKERADVAGAERSLEVGRSEQGPQNEEARNKELFPLDKQAIELRSKMVESNAAMVAAAQEIQNRQQQQASLQAEPGYQRALQGGPAMGKGGGGGGLLGAIMSKGGGGGMAQPATAMGAQAAQDRPAVSAGPVGGGQTPFSGQTVGPTVGQVAGPMIGKILQMPLPQAAGLARDFLGGQFGGNRGDPREGTPLGRAPSGPSPAGSGGAPKPPQRGNGPSSGSGRATTQHFHFHQAPASRPDSKEQAPKPATSQAPEAHDFSAHPEVPASEAGKYGPQPQQQMGPEQMGMQTYGGGQGPLPWPAVGTVVNGHRYQGGHPRDTASWPAVGED